MPFAGQPLYLLISAELILVKLFLVVGIQNLVEVIFVWLILLVLILKRLSLIMLISLRLILKMPISKA